VIELESRFEGSDVPRPDFWGGYRLAPDRIDLWFNQPDRLHDRFRYERTNDGGWLIQRLAP
jgi:pyridoxamine 5'-phosphate oxidase